MGFKRRSLSVLVALGAGLFAAQATQSIPTVIPVAEGDPAFNFTAGGDYGANSYTDAVLRSIAAGEPDFHLALGDLSYSQVTPESSWCDYVLERVGDLPFEVVSGNHEHAGPDGTIDNFAACLPDKMGSQGSYGKQYYFDYLGLARVIMISPNLTIDGERYDYSPGSPRGTWLAQAIDEARSAGLRWVIVGTHTNCLTMGIKTCEMGQPVLDLLVDKKVDLVIQGHDHTYQRSRQISHSPGCPAVVPNEFNPACVVAQENGSYEKGAGSVFAIAGVTGARNLYTVDPADAEAPYFAAAMGLNRHPTKGYLKVSVSADRLDARFVGVIGDYEDRFVIGGDASDSLVTASADAWTDSANPTKNNGTQQQLWVDGSPKRLAHLRFDLEEARGRTLEAALLRLKIADQSNQMQSAHVTSAGSWAENSVTYSSRPYLDAPVYGGYKDSWITIDVTEAAARSLGDALFVNLAAEGGDGLALYSRESGHAPELLLRWSPTLHPTADAYVDGASPASNLGSAPSLAVDTDPMRVAYLTYDLSSLADRTIAAATLRLMVTNPSANRHELKTVDEEWSEGTLTYENRPPPGPAFAQMPATPATGWVEIDVSDIVRSHQGGVLRLAVDPVGPDGLSFSSREGASPPELLIDG